MTFSVQNPLHRLVVGTGAIATALATISTVAGADPSRTRPPQLEAVQLEKLDRGLIAAATSQGVFLSWRLLGTEVTGATEQGVRGPKFRVYRDRHPGGDRHRQHELPGHGQHQDGAVPGGPGGAGGREGRTSARVAPWPQGYVDLPLRKPADGVRPKGDTCTYSANDMSVGDVDGDGSYEYVVKWDPWNSRDVSQGGRSRQPDRLRPRRRTAPRRGPQ